MRGFFFASMLCGLLCGLLPEAKSMQYLSIRNDTNHTSKIYEIHKKHSFVQVVKDEAGRGEDLQLHFFAKRDEEKGDGISISLETGDTLALTWDYEDRCDYYPRPTPSTGKYILVRAENPKKYYFVIIPEKEARMKAEALIRSGQNGKLVQEQIGLDEAVIMEIQKTYSVNRE